MLRAPQVIVTLTPAGGLQVELPGPNGSRRKVPLRAKEAHETITRILQAQLASRTEIGEDGAPTQRQVRHWEQHNVWADDRCPFCLAEGRISASKRQARPLVLAEHGDAANGVVIRRIAPKTSTKQRATRRSEEELGL